MISRFSSSLAKNTKIARYIHQLNAEHLKVTQACQDQIRRKLVSKDKLLRLAVKGGEGCDGFTYEFKAETPKAIDSTD